MSIYRGVGGSVGATNDALVNEVNVAAQTATTKAAEAAQSATNAATSANQAASSAVGVEQYATTATTKASEASSSASQAAASASTASSASTAATTASTASVAARDASQGFRDEAEGFKTSAATSATSASTDASTATTQASSAATSASNASASAGSASTSASQAASSASTALTASNTATTAKNTAVSKASEALSSANSAAASAGSAATSETNAANSAVEAEGYVTDAGEQVVLATAQAQSAADSATDALESGANASASESNAASSAVEADVSETNAANSATSASQSATASQSSYENALAIYGDINAVSQAVVDSGVNKDLTLGYRNEAETFKDQAYTYSQSAASAVAYQDLTAIAQTKSQSAVDVFVYDTRKDSDGGAWRKRTQGTSWYNETLNTATRGSRKEFPAVAVIVAESNKVTIYDGDDPSLPMWMVFKANYGSVSLLSYGLGGSVTSLSAFNGLIAVGSGGSTSSVAFDGLSKFNFVHDKAERNNNNGVYTEPTLIGLSSRNNGGYNTIEYTERRIVNHTVNDIAMTVLPDAPIDPDTGLPIPTIAVATNGGVSVIKDDGTVVDLTHSNAIYSVVTGISFASNNDVVWNFDSTSTPRRVYARTIPASDTAVVAETSYPISPTRGYGAITDVSNGSYGLNLVGTSNALVQGGKEGTLLAGGDRGLSLIDENTTTPSEGMVNYITSTYNTGWMNGDIKLATLSDTDDTDLVGTELVTNGTFDTDTSGWAASNATLSLDSDYLKITSTGGNRPKAYQNITTVVGKTYVITATARRGTCVDPVEIEIGGISSASTGSTSNTTDTIVYSTFVATNTTHMLQVKIDSSNSASGETAFFDNVSVRLAEPDRSVNGNGLQVFGTVQKNPVATGADLVAYSGFSSSNYLQQPYNSDLDFGTGDFCVMGWVKWDGSDTHQTIISKYDRELDVSLPGGQSGRVRFYSRNTANSLIYVDSSTSVASNTWTHICVLHSNGNGYIYINGALQGQGALAANVDAQVETYVGVRNQPTGFTGAASNSQLALLRISGTAPTAEQVAKIYRDEKPLFQENAKATLHGTSDAVTALAYDDSTELLHVGTSAGRSVFSGLQRVDNTTDAVGKAISASNGLVVEE